MGENGKLWRTRWAAIGAAVAVTLGAGGLYSVRAAGSPSAFVSVTPTRVLDTRLPGMGGALTSDTPRTLLVTGIVPTVGSDGSTVSNQQIVPAGATAIVANVTAVFPSTGGFVAVRPASATGAPTTSNLNFTAGGVVVPNSVTVEIPTTGATAGQIQLWFKGFAASATSDILVDVVGYYEAGGTGAQGPAGPAGPTGATGATGPAGRSPWDVIPSGVTVTGNATIDESSTGALVPDAYTITLPGIAPTPLSNGSVQFSSSNPLVLDDDTRCTGTPANPTAPAGVVCIYEYGLFGVQNVAGKAPTYQSDHAFFVEYSATDEDPHLFLVWAYTAP